MSRQLYLVGFMGSGKSTVGPLLADRLSRPFHDLDRLIEERSGVTIPEIFESQGEEAFRRLEEEVLQESSRLPASVIALGGGAFLRIRNRERVKESGLTIWLKVSLENVASRALGDQHRPLARDRETFETLYRERQAAYQEAEIHVTTDDRTPEQVCSEIVRILDHRELEMNGGDT